VKVALPIAIGMVEHDLLNIEIEFSIKKQNAKVALPIAIGMVEHDLLNIEIEFSIKKTKCESSSPDSYRDGRA